MTGSTAKNNSKYIKMVIVPAIKGQMKMQFRTLIATVEKITNIRISIEETSTYRDAVEQLKSGKAHLGWLGAQAYLENAHDAKIEAFAVAIRGKQKLSTYRTIFLVRSDSSIAKIRDLKGKSLSLSQRGSTSGDLMPKHELMNSGLDPNIPTNFKDVKYSGSHDESIALLQKKKCDVAAVSEINYHNLLSKDLVKAEEFRIIHTSAAMPGAPLVLQR